MKKILLTATAATAVFALQATAQEGTYLKGGVGYGVFEEVTVARPGGETEVDPEGNARFMIGIGHAFANNWRVDVDLMDRYADGGAVGDVNGSTDIQNVTAMLNAIYDFNRAGRLNPYIGGGLGVSRSDVGISTTAFGPPVDEEDEETELGAQLLGGLGVRLSPRLTADLEYRYVYLGDVEGSSYSFEDMRSHDVLIGLRYALNGAAAPARAAPAPVPPTAAAPAAAPTCNDVDFIVYFEWDQSDLTDQAAQTIGSASDQASRCSITRVNVVGHADRSGAPAYNVALSERRARAVREELVRRGVPASSISVEARGESDPAVDTPDGAREPLNRRSEVVIVVAGPNA